MSDLFELAETELLKPSGLKQTDLERVLLTVLGRRMDYADLYFQSSQSESFDMEDGIIKTGSFSLDRGVGVRAVLGEKTGFAYADDIVLPALLQAADAARSIAHQSGSLQIKTQCFKSERALYPTRNPLHVFSEQEKIQLLQSVDQYIRAKDTRVTKINLSLIGAYETILIFNSDGELAADVRPLVRCNVSLVVEENGKRETGYAGGGSRSDYHFFTHDNLVFQYADEALRLALINLHAIDAPAGMMPVVLGAGWPGILLHEAIGHGLEGDFNRKQISAYSGRMGESVASPLCTIVDDGTLKGRRGSLNIDDEGTPSQCTTLIENGKLVGYLFDKTNARLMKTQSTGNGRRESYAHLPMPRMTNTYMLPGKSDPEEIIKSVKKGLYAVNFGGGQVDITSGKFVFSANEAYLIENGKIGPAVKGATLIGNGPEVLTKVSMVGHDLKLDTGVGTCGKEGQSVPVGVGQPTLLVDELTVGGTQTG